MCLSGTRGCHLPLFGILEQMEGHALQLSCLALHRVWGTVPDDFIWHGFLHCVQNNKNNKKTVMYELSSGKPQKNEDKND